MEREKLQTVVATTNMQVDEFQQLATAKINAMNFKVEKKEQRLHDVESLF